MKTNRTDFGFPEPDSVDPDVRASIERARATEFMRNFDGEPGTPVYTAEASDLGWAPGYWPRAFDYRGQRWVRFDQPTRCSVTNNDAFAYVYASADGQTMAVYND